MKIGLKSYSTISDSVIDLESGTFSSLGSVIVDVVKTLSCLERDGFSDFSKILSSSCSTSIIEETLVLSISIAISSVNVSSSGIPNGFSYS